MGKAKPKKEKHGPTAEQLIEQDTATRRVADIRVVAYEERCTSPRGVRQIKHRTDVIGGDVSAAKERSRTFRESYEKQGWGVAVRAVTVAAS